MVKAIALLAVAALGAGCVIRATRARDATLPYHPTLDELRAAPRAHAGAPGAGRAVAAQLLVDDFAAGYPQPIGLDYSGAGALRKVTGVEWSDGALEAALAGSLRARLRPGDGPPVRLGGGVVRLALYGVGGAVYVSALLEVRAVRDGDEIYAARYRAAAKGNDASLLIASVADDLVDQIVGDDALFRTIDAGGAP